MTTELLLLNNFFYLLVGLVAGTAWGTFMRGVVMDQQKREIRSPRRWATIATGVAIVALSVVALITVGVTVADFRDQARCQTEVNDQFRLALAERQEGARKDREAAQIFADASVKMLDSLLFPNATVEQRTQAINDWRGAIREYQRLLREANQVRTENPLPGGQAECR